MSKTTDRTKENFEEAFWKLYEEKPISRITVGELTKLAGYNRSTFYEYYLDIYDLLEQIEQTVIRSFTTVLHDHTIFGRKLDEFYILLIEGLPAAFDACTPQITRLLEKQDETNFAEKLLTGVQKEYAAALERHDGEYRYLMDFFFYALMQVLTRWDKLGRPIPLPQLMQPFLAALREADNQIAAR